MAAALCIAGIMLVCTVSMFRALPPGSFGAVEGGLLAVFGLALLAIYALAAWLALRGLRAGARLTV